MPKWVIHYLGNLAVGLSQPIVAAEGTGRLWFPIMARFPSGGLVISMGMGPDEEAVKAGAPMSDTTICFSRDHGHTWHGHIATDARALNVQMSGDAVLCQPGMNSFRFDPPGQRRTMVANYTRLADGGRTYTQEFDGLRVTGIPRDIRTEKSGIPTFYPSNTALRLDDGQVLLLYYAVFEGDRVREHKRPMFYPPDSTIIALTSGDGGRTWHYRGAVAGPAEFPHAMEGPDEAAMIRLADGRLMAMLRVGQTEQSEYLRTYSADEGRTWTPPVITPGIFSVMPSMIRLQNGVIALSSGRPGLYLWLCTDGVGEKWRRIDIAAHHHAVMTREHHFRAAWIDAHQPLQTTACTSLVEVAPNEILMTYDRVPFGWEPVPADSPERNRIFVLRVRVTTKGRLPIRAPQPQLVPRLEVVQRPLRVVSRARPEPGRMRVVLENDTGVTAKGDIELIIKPDGDGGRIMGKASLAYAVKPRGRVVLPFQASPARGNRETIIGARTKGTTMPPVLVTLRTQVLCFVDRLPQPGRDLLAAAAAIKPMPVRAGKTMLGRVRLALAGDGLLVRADVRDRRINRGNQPWEGSAVEVFGAMPEPLNQVVRLDETRLGHVYLLPATPLLPATALKDRGDPPITAAPAVEIQCRIRAGGYALAALVPLSLLTIDHAAKEFLLEVQITTASSSTRTEYQRGSLFGSTNAFENILWYGRVRPARSPKSKSE